VGIRVGAECGGLDVEQACEKQGRSSNGEVYCQEYSNTLVVREGQEGGNRVEHVLEASRGRVNQAWAECGEEGWQLVIFTQDSALISLTPRGNVMWTREEALADIQNVVMVALGSGQGSAAEFSSSTWTLDPTLLLQAMLGRLRRHLSQAQSAVLSLADWRFSGAKGERGGALQGDRFGLRKVVVVATGKGALYGLDSGSGSVVWRARVEGTPKSLHLQRDGRTDRSKALASLVYTHSRSNSFILSFNPITGSVVEDRSVALVLDQVLLLPETADCPLRPLLLVGKDFKAEVVPASAAQHIASLPRLFVSRRRREKVWSEVLSP